MRLPGFLPPSSRLNAGTFEVWDPKRKDRRLSISNYHQVTAKLGHGRVYGSAKLSYVVQVPDHLQELPLSVSRRLPPIGNQAPDLLRSLTEAYRPRASVSLAEVGAGTFDLRSLTYVLGAAAACGSSNTPFPYASRGVGVSVLSPSWTIPSTNHVVMDPGLVTTDSEFQSFSSICRMAGVGEVVIMGDSIPVNSAAPIQGGELASFALRVLSFVLSAADSCGCADHHLMALFRGMSSVFTLWGHTDEGGWLRSAMSAASYPPSAGVLSSTRLDICGLPSRKYIPAGDTTRYCLGYFLEMAATVPVADAFESGLPEVFIRNGDEPRPSSFAGLRDRFYCVMDKWRELIAVSFGVTYSLILDAHSAYHFFKSDKVDTHLSGDAIIPFWWVEPCALYTGDAGACPMPARLGTRRELPLVRLRSLQLPKAMESFAGPLPRGTPMRLVREPGGLRDEGMSYLMNVRYREENGLSRAEYIELPSLGVHTTDALFVNQGECNAHRRRWVTPHNPLPNPAEGYTDLPTALEYVFGEGFEAAPQDWVDCKVESVLGYFQVDIEAPTLKKVVHKRLPSFLRHVADKYSRSSEWVSATPFKSPPEKAGLPFQPPLPPEKVRSEPAITDGDVAPSSGPVDTPGAGKPPIPKISTEEVTVPVAPPHLPGDPKIATVVSNRAGGRPGQPHVQQEAQITQAGKEPPTPESSD